MGNAAITIHHPTCLDHGVPNLESGKLVESTNSMIRLEKRDCASVGCGGRIQFRKIVMESNWTYKYIRAASRNIGLDIGTEVKVKGESEQDATHQIALKFGITDTEVRECFTLIKSTTNDSSASVYSELYVYYQGNNQGRYEWTNGNPLGLKATHRWAEDSEMLVDIHASWFVSNTMKMGLVGEKEMRLPESRRGREDHASPHRGNRGSRASRLKMLAIELTRTIDAERAYTFS